MELHRTAAAGLGLHSEFPMEWKGTSSVEAADRRLASLYRDIITARCRNGAVTCSYFHYESDNDIRN